MIIRVIIKLSVLQSLPWHYPFEVVATYYFTAAWSPSAYAD